jgi:uncharacterized protein
MNAYRAPGIFFEWLDERTRQLAPRRTDVVGFVGLAARGPLHEPVRLESWTQFVSVFGGHIPQGYLAYAVEGFFANGGRRCYVVRVADPARAECAHLYVLEQQVWGQRPKPNTRTWLLFKLVASSPGTWAHSLVVSTALLGAGRFSLSLSLPDGTYEKWANLSLDSADRRAATKVLNERAAGSRLVRAEPVTGFERPMYKSLLLGRRPMTLAGGADGLTTLQPAHLSGQDAPPNIRWGLATLELIDEIAIVAIPDLMVAPRPAPLRRAPRPRRCDLLEASEQPPTPDEPPELPPARDDATTLRLQQALVGHCERLKDRVAILDARPQDVTPAQVLSWREQFASSYAALYYPWLLVPDPLRGEGDLLALPSSGHVAGIYARSDRIIGVHKAPANERIEGVPDIVIPLDDTAHGDLNDGGVNVIRPYPARGVRVAGARTLASPGDRDAPRYINVRRLLLMIEEAIDEQIQWVTFEPNSEELWAEVDRVVRGFLDGLWRDGMLDGATAEEAYSVRCDAATNPPDKRELGEITCQIGVRLPWPAEYVIVRIGRTEGGTSIQELIEASDDNNRRT